MKRPGSNFLTHVLAAVLVLPIVAFCSGCAPSLSALDKYVQSQGFIPYTTPTQNVGPGTILGGTPSELTFVASPETCFPASLIHSDPTSLPSEASSITATGSLGVSLSNMAAQLVGGWTAQGSVSFSKLQQVQLQVGNAEIDWMDLVELESFYATGLSPGCQSYLNLTGFVLEGLKVDQLSFQFIDNSGAAIDLTAAYMGIGGNIGTSWSVQNKTTLVISSPTYLGYQVGSLRNSSQGLVLYRAADVSNGQFDFKPLSIFSKP